MNNSHLRIVLFVATPSLLYAPVLYYSLMTPFGLVDDYGDWQYAYINSWDNFWNWFHRTFIDFSNVIHGRYRPSRALYNAFAWSLFGPVPWVHHLVPWGLHFGAVFLFMAAFRSFSRNQRQENLPVAAERKKIDDLLPLVFLMYVWIFFPNSPSSRLPVQELFTVCCLGSCTWMTALMLSKRGGEKKNISSFSQHVVFHMSYVGLCWSKEVNVAVALWILIFYCVFLVSGNNRRKLVCSTPLALIFLHTFGMVYAAWKINGVGYKSYGIVPRPAHENAIEILEGLFQTETSPVVTVGFAILFAISVIFAVLKVVNRNLGNESIFILFLLGQFMTLFSILSLSFGVVLRYWYPLIPVLATLLAFSVKFILKSIRGHHPTITYGGIAILAIFVAFFVAVNSYNFLLQTIIQYSLRHTDQRLISEISHLTARGEYVQIDYPGHEMEDKLLINIPGYLNFAGLRNHQPYQTYKNSPKSGGEHFFVTRKKLPIVEENRLTIVPQSNFRLLSYTSTVASALQGKPAFSKIDAGVHSLDWYQWHIYRMTDGEIRLSVPSESQRPLIPSEFDVYFDRNQNMLIYVKEPCREEDYSRAPFFVHVTPADRDALPESRKEYGFENRDFVFNERGILRKDKCAAAYELPNYPISKIATGQFTGKTQLWVVHVDFDE